MQIIEIKEPNNQNENNELVVGIDFGTTNSLIAYSKNHSPKIIHTIDNNELLPSIISYNLENTKFIIGTKNPKNPSISSIKRILGKSYNEIISNETLKKIVNNFSINGSSVPKISFGNKSYSSPELASKIFSHLKKAAESEIGENVTKAVISVPAYFDDSSRGAVLLAAQLAGFEVLRLIAEPTAAAYAYGFDKKSEGTYMIYDLGGGTFDVSILNMHNGIFQVVATSGDNLLGGDDFDHILVQYLAEKFETQITEKLYFYAKRMKESLSTQTFVTLLFEEEKEIYLNNKTFKKLIEPLVDRTIKIAKDTLSETDLVLDGIIIVGGSTRMPIISKKLSQSFKVQIFSDIDPDKAVVIGAALQGENLSSSSSKNTLLIDVLPLSVGLELYGGIAEKIIMRNTPIPFSSTKSFTTHVDMQTGMEFHIVQGEREMVKDCRSIGRFELKNIPPMKAGIAKIEVTFAIDADAILSVTAKELTSGIVHNIDIKPTYGMDATEVNNLLEAAFLNAKEDYDTKLLTEARLDAENLIFGIDKAINETSELLNKSEKKEIYLAIESLKKILNSGDREEILEKILILNKSASSFIQKHLDRSAKLLLEGKNINDIMRN